ncbi:hypothetical protein VTJ49DRAFT_7062 [Mycothermus thermophilus]|uniref:Uncharacterized protein n=1 Tax=Humicola insolens TaxID=85995 RepID=A0ABR3VI94_HUMIN
MAWARLWWWSCLLAATRIVRGQQTGQHPDWPRWCGKVYEAGYPNFDPGGRTERPPPAPNAPLLHVQFRPRYSLYLDNEEYGEFVVNAEFSPYHGKPWPFPSSGSKWADRLIFSINLVENDDPLVQNTVLINTTSNIFRFELSRLKPSLRPIEVVLYGASENGVPTWTATTTLLYLPTKPSGSATRIDNLNGNLYFSSAATNRQFVPILPYGFYASHDGFLRLNDTALIDRYADLGLTAMVPLTTFDDSPEVLNYMSSSTPVRIMYSLRDGYKNLSYVRSNVLAARDAEGLFAYWSADEPDGWQDPFDAPRAAYDNIRELDPYHPVAVTLNCQDYYFGEYSAPADILMADVYPIGINSTWSKWGTECNITHGDCGCDHCEGTVQDVPDRLDLWRRHEQWLGRWPKPMIFNPQAFHGQDYWLRDPSKEESWVMVLLAVNHGAKGSISWLWPTSAELAVAHGELATALTKPEVSEFLGTQVVDAAGWLADGKMLVGVVNGGPDELQGLQGPLVVQGNTAGPTRTRLSSRQHPRNLFSARQLHPNLLPKSRRTYTTTPPPPPTSATAQSTRLNRLLTRFPPSLQHYASRLRGAPTTHVAAFLLLHELTAVVPLFGLFGVFHYWFGGGSEKGEEGERNLVSWMLEHCGGYFAEGVGRFERWFRRRGWFGFGEEEEEGERGVGRADVGGESVEGVLQRWERDAKYRVVVEIGLAYAITKVLLPVRIASRPGFWLSHLRVYGSRLGCQLKILVPESLSQASTHFFTASSLPLQYMIPGQPPLRRRA